MEENGGALNKIKISALKCEDEQHAIQNGCKI